MMDWNRVVAVAERAAREAGDLLVNLPIDILQEKSAGNLVTAADLRAEQQIVNHIREQFPGHAILAEESAQDVAVDAEHLWIVDPLDGTNNFAHRIPQFCVSLAYAQRGVVQVGVVYDPHRRELFRSWGGTATLNGRPIRVADRPRLRESIVATGFYYDRGELMKRTLHSIETLFTHGLRGIRRFGSAALDLCWVACGRFDGYFEYQLAPWDFAAGAHLVQAAGGICSDRQGGELRLDGRGMIAASAAVHAELLQQVGW